MGNAEIFMEAYNKLDHYLEFLLDGEKASFIDKKNRLKYNRRVRYTIERYDQDLEAINRLRNVVSHERFLGGRPMADPREDVIDKLGEIFEALARPMTVFERRSPVPPMVFRASEPLGRVLKYMMKNDFSQVVVEKSGSYTFLRREDTARWLEKSAEGPIPDPDEIRIEQLIPGDVRHKCHIAKDATVYEALAYFQENDEGYPALIITERGSNREMPLGVITPMDIIDYVSITGPSEL